MSLDPDFKSSVYGLVVGTEAALFALSVAVLGASVATPPDQREHGGSRPADARAGDLLGLSRLHADPHHLAIGSAQRGRVLSAARDARMAVHRRRDRRAAFLPAVLPAAVAAGAGLAPGAGRDRRRPRRRGGAARVVAGACRRPAAGSACWMCWRCWRCSASARVSRCGRRCIGCRQLRRTVMADPEKIIPAVTHEPADISGRFILGAVGLVLGTLLVITVGVLIAFPAAASRPNPDEQIARLSGAAPAAEPAPGHAALLRQRDATAQRHGLDRQVRRHRAHPDRRTRCASSPMTEYRAGRRGRTSRDEDTAPRPPPAVALPTGGARGRASRSAGLRLPAEAGSAAAVRRDLPRRDRTKRADRRAGGRQAG